MFFSIKIAPARGGILVGAREGVSRGLVEADAGDVGGGDDVGVVVLCF